MSAPPVLDIQSVTKSFGQRQVLRGVSLAVAEHDAVALIGASGSGKSTLLRCVDLLEEIDDGDVFLDGEVITDPTVDPVAIRRRLGVVFQAYNLFPHLSVLDNVVLGARRAQGVARRRGGAAGSRTAVAVRPGRQGGGPPRPALRRPAAAGRDRPGDRHAARALIAR